MFTIYCKDVDGRKFDRYYKRYESALKTMYEDIDDIEKIGGKLIESVNRMNHGKGCWDRWDVWQLADGTIITLSVFDGYFSD